MRVPPTSFRARRRTIALAAGACAVLLTAQAAAEVIVVTDSRNPVSAPAGARVIELDRASRLEAELSAGLSANPAEAAAAAQHRLHAGGAPLQQDLAQAWQDVADAWSQGVVKLPAVVVDRRYVVYGEPDAALAISRIEAHRRTQP